MNTTDSALSELSFNDLLKAQSQLTLDEKKLSEQPDKWQDQLIMLIHIADINKEIKRRTEFVTSIENVELDTSDSFIIVDNP